MTKNRIWFTDAKDWERQNANVLDFAEELTLSPAQVDDLFRGAGRVLA